MKNSTKNAYGNTNSNQIKSRHVTTPSHTTIIALATVLTR
jgi:hypothetical protein